MNKRKTICCMLCAFGVSLCIAGCNNTETALHPSIAMPGSTATAEIELPETLTVEIPDDSACVYELSFSVEDNLSEIEQCLDISLDSATKHVNGETLSFSTDNYAVMLDTNTGYWSYNKKEDPSDSFAVEDFLSDEEVEKIARDFVEKNQLWDGEFSNVIVTSTTTGFGQDERVISKDVYLYPSVNGQAVYGLFRIVITVDSTGKITDVFNLTSDIRAKKAVKLIDKNQIQRMLDKGEYSASFSQDLFDTQVERCVLSYYADAVPVDGTTYLYPVYLVLGNGMTDNELEESFDIIIDAVQ